MGWQSPAEAAHPPRDHWQALRRGLFGRCPNCGRGAMFRKYLKVADRCPTCDEALHHQRADDAPAYFVILILGHLVVPMSLAVEVAFAPPYWVHAMLWGPLTVAAALLLLPAIKGALIGWQWANYMHGFDPRGADEFGSDGLAVPTATPAR
jgi:uncharacterized protein (DUF983 family)